MCPEPSIKVDGIAGESGVSTTILDIGTNGDENKGGSPVAVWRALCNAECLQALIDHSPRIHRSCHRTMSHQVSDPLRYQKSIATRIIGQSNTHSG